jgi:hypothetical protein
MISDILSSGEFWSHDLAIGGPRCDHVFVMMIQFNTPLALQVDPGRSWWMPVQRTRSYVSQVLLPTISRAIPVESECFCSDAQHPLIQTRSELPSKPSGTFPTRLQAPLPQHFQNQPPKTSDHSQRDFIHLLVSMLPLIL